MAASEVGRERFGPTVGAGEFISDPPPHPFDLPDFRHFLETSFPVTAEGLDRAHRPGLSPQPDELEIWEAEQMLGRRPPFDGEDNRAYLIRLLYEETLGLEPPPMVRDMPILPPGGLISRFYRPDWRSQIGSVEILTWPEIEVPDMARALGLIEQNRGEYSANRFLEDVLRMSRMPGDQSRPILQAHHLREVLEAAESPEERVAAVGHRLLRMLHFVPEMVEPTQDAELKDRFTPPRNRNSPSKPELLSWAWLKSQDLLAEETGTPEAQTALECLLFLRLHPEMQIFYQYLSPSGYINERQPSS